MVGLSQVCSDRNCPEAHNKNVASPPQLRIRLVLICATASQSKQPKQTQRLCAESISRVISLVLRDSHEKLGGNSPSHHAAWVKDNHHKAPAQERVGDLHFDPSLAFSSRITTLYRPLVRSPIFPSALISANPSRTLPLLTTRVLLRRAFCAHSPSALHQGPSHQHRTLRRLHLLRHVQPGAQRTHAPGFLLCRQ